MFVKQAIRIGIVAAVVALAGSAPAQDAENGQPRSLEDAWSQMLHYIRIGNVDMTQSYGQYILQQNPEPMAVYNLSADRVGLREGENAMQVLTRGLRLPSEAVNQTLGQIMKLINRGYTDLRRDDAQIVKSIEMLSGTLEQYETGRKRLIESGEYALPRLISVLTQSDDKNLRARVASVLGDMPKEAIRGLTMALQSDEPNVVKTVAGALARIGYPWSAPRLKEALAREDLVEEARNSVREALVAVAGSSALQKPLAQVWYDWSERYYSEAESLMPDPREDEAFIWYWNDSWKTVEKVSVPRPIFNEVYAMRFSRKALQVDPDFYRAIPLWIAAITRRQVQLPEGQSDPLIDDNELHAADYVLATSPEYLQQALARAMDDEDTEVAFRIIEGLAKTQGTSSLVQSLPGGAQPLVSAMTYPSRRVRFLAAISLANAQPQKSFTGDQLVLPTLGLALRQTGDKTAMLVGADNELKAAIRDQGYNILEADDATSAVTEALDAAGVDVFVLGPGADLAEVMGKIQQQPTLQGTAVVIASSGPDVRVLQRRYKRVAGIGRNVDQEMLAAGLKQATEGAVGTILDPAEANTWAQRAADAIYTLSLDDTIFSLSMVVEPLKTALGSNSADVQAAAARALGGIETVEAQQALADAGLDAGKPESVRIAAFQAASRSLQKFGNRLKDDQAQAVVQLVVSDASRDLRNAAAQALGSMNLASDRIKMLLLSSEVD
ncbi:MAG: HEAT repeat domain-containing protein [Phycisphaerae bacterium]